MFDRACEPEPNDRQPSAKTLRQELELLRQNESVLHLRELQTREQWRRRRWRQTKIAAVIVVPVIAVTLGFLALWIQRQNLQHRAWVAELERRQLFRNGERLSGCSRSDWASAQNAVTLGAGGSFVAARAGAALKASARARVERMKADVTGGSCRKGWARGAPSCCSRLQRSSAESRASDPRSGTVRCCAASAARRCRRYLRASAPGSCCRDRRG